MSQLFTSGDQVLELHFSIIPSNDYSGLISFKIDWFDFLAVQGTLKSLLQRHGSKASTLRYIGKWILYHWLTWETQVILCSITNHPKTLLLQTIHRLFAQNSALWTGISEAVFLLVSGGEVAVSWCLS